MELHPDMDGSAEAIQPTISEKAFHIGRQKERDEQRSLLRPDVEKTAEAIQPTISEKAFYRDRQKEMDEQRAKLHPDIAGIGEKIQNDVGSIEELKKKKNDPSED